MGYETRFHIKAIRQNDGPDFAEIRKQALEWGGVDDETPFTAKHRVTMGRYVAACDALTASEWADFDYVECGQEAKFYNWRDVLTKLSVGFPDFVFRIEWHGEDMGDHGHAEFFKGKTREAKAVLPPLPEEWS